jgi:hypothetical protein
MILKSNDDYEFKIVPEDSPYRCQHVTRHMGQCRCVIIKGSRFCKQHGGNKHHKHDKIKSMQNYQLTQFKARTQSLSESNNIASLKDEVAILRMLVEERINRCKSPNDLILMSGPLSDLIVKVQKVTESMNKLEDKLGKHLNKDKVLQFAQLVIEIIAKYIENEETMDAIGEDILALLSKSNL